MARAPRRAARRSLLYRIAASRRARAGALLATVLLTLGILGGALLADFTLSGTYYFAEPVIAGPAVAKPQSPAEDWVRAHISPRREPEAHRSD